jgi:hypothetical protein
LAKQGQRSKGGQGKKAEKPGWILICQSRIRVYKNNLLFNLQQQLLPL